MKVAIKDLYDSAMGVLMKYEATTHKRFFTQSEFEKNKGRIFIITNAKTKLDLQTKPV